MVITSVTSQCNSRFMGVFNVSLHYKTPGGLYRCVPASTVEAPRSERAELRTVTQLREGTLFAIIIIF